MQHITSSLSPEQSPQYKEFPHLLNDENQGTQDELPLTSYQLNLSGSANPFYIKDFSWEYFSNELEFE